MRRARLEADLYAIVRSSDLGFGDPVAAGGGEDGARITRAGSLLKRIIPQKYLKKNMHAVYAHADEFLILPEGIDNIRTAIRILERTASPALPHRLSTSTRKDWRIIRLIRARSFSDLLERYPYYDATLLVELVADDWPKPLGEGASACSSHPATQATAQAPIVPLVAAEEASAASSNRPSDARRPDSGPAREVIRDGQAAFE